MVASRITERLAATRPHGALLPYFTSGFPDVDATAEFIRRADHLGVAAVELGIPYSDSIADGPVIQSSFHAALDRGHQLQHALDLVAQLRPTTHCAIIAMLSYSMVHRFGLQSFMQEAHRSGFDGVILPDVPVEESTPTSKAAQDAGLSYIGLVAPTTSPTRREATVRNCSGFVYQIATAGTTGERASLADTLGSEIASLRELTALPICVGFGVSSASHVREVCGFADGAIVGSALVRRIQEGIDARLDSSALADSVQAALSELVSGTTPSRAGS